MRTSSINPRWLTDPDQRLKDQDNRLQFYVKNVGPEQAQEFHVA